MMRLDIKGGAGLSETCYRGVCLGQRSARVTRPSHFVRVFQERRGSFHLFLDVSPVCSMLFTHSAP